MTRYFRPRNWDRHQGYKKRGPKWIKNYLALLDDPDYLVLTPGCRAALHGIWLLYARQNRPLPWATSYLSRVLNMDSRGLCQYLDMLLSNNFIELAGENVAEVSHTFDQSVVARALQSNYREEQNITPNGVMTPAASEVPEGTLKDQIWGPCLRWLARQSEKPVDKLRPLLGKWCKVYGEGAVLEAMQRAERASPVDPVSWLTKALQANGAADGDAQVEEMLRQAAEEADRRGIA